jgi:hypothetical protein
LLTVIAATDHLNLTIAEHTVVHQRAILAVVAVPQILFLIGGGRGVGDRDSAICFLFTLHTW